ncbi:outer membrane beta-barrel protein [Candidatus Liberibacter africanus]|uniref:outer membrane protein n=1 Tax=Liberibacter africanus TaxID=34020 RepID=UPI00339D33FC
MQKFFLAIGVSSITLASFCAVQAADPVHHRRNPSRDPSRGSVPTIFSNRYVSSLQNFVGPYAGVSGLYESDFTTIDHDHNLAGVNIFGGYNVEDYGVVYGIEGNIRYTFDLENLVSRGYKLHGLGGSLRARLGYEVVDSVLLYGTGGVSTIERSYRSPVANKDVIAFPIGGVLGVGAETILVDNIIGRLEYTATKYKSSTIKNWRHSASIGIGMKF